MRTTFEAELWAMDDLRPDEVAPILRDIGSWLIQISDRDKSALNNPALPLPKARERPMHNNNDEEMLARLAGQEYYLRERRRKFFDQDLFGEPSWDILLDLYVSKVNGRTISVTSACIGSGVPMTTALRWLADMEGRGLIVRKCDNKDKRRSWISISEKGFDAMSRYLLEKAKRVNGKELVVAGFIPRRPSSHREPIGN
jgi:DNA-binding MarR family transcriptional regulator